MFLGCKCCDEPCNTAARSGGAGITINRYAMPDYGGTVEFYYNAYRVPDRFTIYNTNSEDEIYFDTGERVSGSKTIKFYKPKGVRSVSVKVNGPSGTAWEYRIGCPERTTTCLTYCDTDENDNPYFSQIKSVTLTIEAEDFEVSIPSFGYEYRSVVYADTPQNRLFGRVGDFAFWVTRQLDSSWSDDDVLFSPYVRIAFGFVVADKYQELEWGSGVQKVEFSSKASIPLGIFNGTFELELTEDGKYVYDFGDCEYECSEEVYGENGLNVPSTKLVFNPYTCQLYVEDFKYYVSINTNGGSNCDEVKWEPYSFQFKTVPTAAPMFFGLGVSCDTDGDNGLIGINKDTFFDIHPFCNSIDNNQVFGAINTNCPSFNEADSENSGFFSKFETTLTLVDQTYNFGEPSVTTRTQTANVGYIPAVRIKLSDCRGVDTQLFGGTEIDQYIYSTLLGCKIPWFGLYPSSPVVEYTIFTATSEIYGNIYMEDKIPWYWPELPSFANSSSTFKVIPKEDVAPEVVDFLDERGLIAIDTVGYTQTWSITGNTYQKSILLNGKNNIILKRIDVEFEDPQ